MFEGRGAAYHARRRGTRSVVVITGNAKYHHARLHRERRAQNANGFAVDSLPPYSPELSPIERVWKLTRRPCPHDRYFARLEDVATAVEAEFEGWRRWLKDLASIAKNRIQPRLRSLPAFDILTRPTPAQCYALDLLSVKLSAM